MIADAMRGGWSEAFDAAGLIGRTAQSSRSVAKIERDVGRCPTPSSMSSRP